MINVWLHSTIRQNSEMLAEHSFNADYPISIGEVIKIIGQKNELFYFGLIDETGTLRPHINIFVESEKINNLAHLIENDTSISIFPSVSGG